MHQRPQHHIQQNYQIDIEQGHQAQIEEGKEGGNEEGGDHGGAVAHAQGQKLVVNVGLVRHERVAMKPNTPDHHTNRVIAGTMNNENTTTSGLRKKRSYALVSIQNPTESRMQGHLDGLGARSECEHYSSH